MENGLGRGSGRAPRGFDLRATLEKNRGLLARFGGHARAVGVEIQAAHLDTLRDLLAGDPGAPAAAAAAAEAPLIIDTRAELDEWQPEALAALAEIGPYDEEHQEPVCLAEGALFDGGARPCGHDHKDLAVTVRQAGVSVRARFPGGAASDHRAPRGRGPFRLVYTPRAVGRTGGGPEIVVQDIAEEHAIP
jgi:single-stranded-DNA-specific exonuclease